MRTAYASRQSFTKGYIAGTKTEVKCHKKIRLFSGRGTSFILSPYFLELFWRQSTLEAFRPIVMIPDEIYA